VRGVDRSVKSGGLLAKDPLVERPIYDSEAKVFDYDIWFDPPRQRVLWAERYEHPSKVVTSIHTFFDGSVYTHLTPLSKAGLLLKGAAMVRPLTYGPVHAVGLCFPHTYQTSLATLLGDPSKVTVKRLASRDKQEEWLVQVKSLPQGVRPRDWGDKACRSALVLVWVTIDADVVINRWAIYSPSSGNPDRDSELYGRSIPSFYVDGYNLFYAFLNCDFGRVRDEVRGRDMRMPKRILHGNGNATVASTMEEMIINPRPGPHTFRPTIPPGYSVTKMGEDGETSISVAGGKVGSIERVHEISEQARQMLDSGNSLRAQPSTVWAWAVPIACATLALAGAVLLILHWRKNV
jgi:hypothetical protein